METSNPRKAGALIINNISMFNEAAILVEEHITGNIFEKFLEIINQSATPAMPFSPVIA